MSKRRKTPLESETIEPAACTIDLRLEILQRLPFFTGLSLAEITAVNRQFHEYGYQYGYQPGEIIYLSGT